MTQQFSSARSCLRPWSLTEKFSSFQRWSNTCEHKVDAEGAVKWWLKEHWGLLRRGKRKGKSKLVPLHNQVPRHEDIWRNGSIVPRVLSHGTRWRWVVSSGRFIPGERAPDNDARFHIERDRKTHTAVRKVLQPVRGLCIKAEYSITGSINRFEIKPC